MENKRLGCVNRDNKQNYCNTVGYVSKMISENEILYTWIHVNWIYNDEFSAINFSK